MRARCLALAATVAALSVSSMSAQADGANLTTLHVQGRSGDAYVVTAPTRWRPDFAHARLTGGRHYAGVAVELLGRPADDGLSTVVANLPTGPSTSGRTRINLGAVDAAFPPGRYLIVLLGDRPVQVTIPLRAGTVSEPRRVDRRAVAFRERTADTSFAPQATGLYDGQVAVALPPVDDPIVMTRLVVHDVGGPHTFDVASCVTQASARCAESRSPEFGVRKVQEQGGESVLSDAEFWDGADGLAAQQRGWRQEGDYRGSSAGVRMYTAALVFSGGNS